RPIFPNPAAFATPAPGTFGNLERNSIHGPGFKQIDMVIAKRIGRQRGLGGELRLAVFTVFNATTAATPPGPLPNARPAAGESPTQANRVQPGQPYTAGAAGS